MSRQWKLVVAAAVLPLLISACNDSSNGSSPGFAQGGDFTQFVKSQFDVNPETDAPQEINQQGFVFNDLDNPNAYDDLLGNL